MVDFDECVRRGAVGAAGAVPGTLAAHPFDVLKMRQQVSGSSVSSVINSVRGGRTGVASVAAFWQGAGAGVAQKVLTRGPMFLVSEAATQGVQQATGTSRDRAVALGSACSGYVTGLCAAPAEWAKVQRGVAGTSAASLLRARGGFTRLHGAGLRNSIFDSTFFSVEHAGRTRGGLPPWLSYACAAVAAVVLDYPVDVAVKRSMAAPPEESVAGPLLATARLLRTHRWGVFTGLSSKAAEFSVSYAVTGLCSTYILRVSG